MDLGDLPPGDFSTYVEQLDPETTYYYRCYAWSTDDATWSADSTSFFVPEYGRWLSRRMKITFEGYDGVEELVEFPALVRVSETLSGFAYTNCETNGGDLRFVDQSGTEVLPYEIENWDTNGEVLRDLRNHQCCSDRGPLRRGQRRRMVRG